MRKALSIAFGAIILVCSQAVAVQAEEQPENLDVSGMTMAEIKAHNAGRAKLDPMYIVCRTYKITGSLSRRERTCHTVARWKMIEERGKEYLGTLQERSRICTSPECEGN
ncbi:MAG: hypothetical protein ACO25F_02335 [Erythrobacter sp.]